MVSVKDRGVFILFGFSFASNWVRINLPLRKISGLMAPVIVSRRYRNVSRKCYKCLYNMWCLRCYR